MYGATYFLIKFPKVVEAIDTWRGYKYTQKSSCIWNIFTVTYKNRHTRKGGRMCDHNMWAIERENDGYTFIFF